MDATLLLCSHKNINLNAQNASHATPLLLAAKNGFENVASLLLSFKETNENACDDKVCLWLMVGHPFTMLHPVTASNSLRTY